MPFFDPSNMIEIEPVAGWKGRALHGERITLVTYSIDAGAHDVHEHHPQEEAWTVLEGELAVWIDGEERTLTPGGVAVIPPRRPSPGPRADGVPRAGGRLAGAASASGRLAATLNQRGPRSRAPRAPLRPRDPG